MKCWRFFHFQKETIKNFLYIDKAFLNVIIKITEYEQCSAIGNGLIVH